MTETGAATMTRPGIADIGTVGVPIPGYEIRLADDGEVLVRTDSAAVGYRNQPEETAATFAADGWIRTGDLGTLDNDRRLREIDRKKELLIPDHGHNIAPAQIESELKSACPTIGHACVVGDGHPYLAALIVLEPPEIANDKHARTIVAEAIAQVNATHDPRERLETHAILPASPTHGFQETNSPKHSNSAAAESSTNTPTPSRGSMNMIRVHRRPCRCESRQRSSRPLALSRHHDPGENMSAAADRLCTAFSDGYRPATAPPLAPRQESLRPRQWLPSTEAPKRYETVARHTARRALPLARFTPAASTARAPSPPPSGLLLTNDAKRSRLRHGCLRREAAVSAAGSSRPDAAAETIWAVCQPLVAGVRRAWRPRGDSTAMTPRPIPPDQIQTPSIKIGIEEGRRGSVPALAPRPTQPGR
jgi:hypothetical protein